MVRYQQLLDAVCRMLAVDAGIARAAAEATLTALARRLEPADRERLLDALPTELRDDFPISGPARDWEPTGFVEEVAALGRRPAEQARVRAQAVLAALAEQDPDLVAGLPVPSQARELFTPPYAGGGITGPHGGTPPLTADELAAALQVLPYWSGDTRALTRTVELPADNLDRVLDRVAALRRELGRVPTVHRRDGAADLVVRTEAAGAVTALDVDLAARVDEVIDEAAAGIASP